MQYVKLVSIGLIAALGLSACATDEYGNRREMTDTEKGVLIGAAAGALLGRTQSSDKTGGTILGAIGGGLAGGLVGNYMDNQKKDLEKALAPQRSAGIVDIEKLPNDVLQVTMTTTTAFDIDSAQIKPGFYGTLDKIASVVNKYGKTHLTIVGYTDSTGSAAHNQALSVRRADAVRDYFLGKGVVVQRLTTIGKGESEPRASNDTAEGRALNRRVEIFIEPVVAPATSEQ